MLLHIGRFSMKTVDRSTSVLKLLMIPKDNNITFTRTMAPDIENLKILAHYRMPFGKFKGRYLVDLPEAYLIWFRQKGYPEGKLGNLLKEMTEIKINGLEPLIRKIQKDFPLQ